MQKKSYAGFFLISLLFICLLFYGNHQFTQAQPGGTDFLYRWLPTRLVLFEGYENLYSPEVEYQVELVHHGHAHTEDETPGIFAYPYYTMTVIFPFALIRDFATARAAFMTLLELANIAIIALSLATLKTQPSKLMFFVLMLFAIFTADFSQGLVDGNPASLAALFAFLALYTLSRKSDIPAGILLALSTIKPQLVILFTILVVLWAFFQRRYIVIYSAAATMLVLFGVSFALQPSWFTEFLKDITTYPGIASPSTPLAILSYWMPVSTATLIARALTILCIPVLLGTWIKSFKNGFDGLFWAACITFTIMPFTGITSAKSNYIAMLPGIILLIEYGWNGLKTKSVLSGGVLLIWIILSWLFFFAGRNLTISGTLIFFVDFYPMPLVLLALYSIYYPYNRSVKLEHSTLRYT